jgi:hypothetical protein
MEESFIAIENNLQPKSLLGESSSGMGLDNIAKRYEFLSNQKVGVSQDNGIFKVKLPIISQS